MPRDHILQFKKHCPVVWTNSQTWGSFFEEVPFWVKFKMCLHTFQCLGLGTVSVGKAAPSSQSTKLYCFRDILCRSLSYGLIINIYTFSKWICCANKHWCFFFFFNISWIVCKSLIVQWQVTQSSSAALTWSLEPWKNQKQISQLHCFNISIS